MAAVTKHCVFVDALCIRFVFVLVLTTLSSTIHSQELSSNQEEAEIGTSQD